MVPLVLINQNHGSGIGMRYETTIGKDRGIRTGMKDKAGAPAVFSEQVREPR